MLTDWFTIIAQIVNFLILVLLLRHFLYHRVVRAMDERESAIASSWKEAEESRRKAEEKAAEYRERSQEISDAREQALARAREEARELRQDLLEKARQEIDRLRREWQKGLESEEESFLAELGRRAAHEVCAISRRVLSDMANAAIERRLVERFVEQLEGLDGEDRQRFLEGDGRSMTVRSTFSIEDDLRDRVVSALRRTLAEDLEVTFETSSDLLCGVEVTTGGYRIAWDVGDYLDRLEERVSAALRERSASVTSVVESGPEAPARASTTGETARVAHAKETKCRTGAHEA